jgi:spore coat polysaccharide biosynthesis protein SpsF (cytidylyltransferase family)
MNLCIIQARMGSTRLPGKVLMKVGEKSILQHVIDRLSPSSKVSHFVVATTTQPEDDAIEQACAALGVHCYRGSDWDVLDRFYQAAMHFAEKPTTIIRICCDNPTHHFEAIDFTLDEFARYGVDYFSNGNEGPVYYEDGFTSEVFSFQSLEQAWKESTMLSEREHVTPYIKRSGKFSCGWRKLHADYNFKLSVDTPEDLAVASKVFADLGDMFTIDQLVNYLQQYPELAIHDPAQFNLGYQKSLREDKKVK